MDIDTVKRKPILNETVEWLAYGKIYSGVVAEITPQLISLMSFFPKPRRAAFHPNLFLKDVLWCEERECWQYLINNESVRLQNLINNLFEAIKHGDDKHQRWLQQAIKDHFDGKPVKRE